MNDSILRPRLPSTWGANSQAAVRSCSKGARRVAGVKTRNRRSATSCIRSTIDKRNCRCTSAADTSPMVAASRVLARPGSQYLANSPRIFTDSLSANNSRIEHDLFRHFRELLCHDKSALPPNCGSTCCHGQLVRPCGCNGYSSWRYHALACCRLGGPFEGQPVLEEGKKSSELRANS